MTLEEIKLFLRLDSDVDDALIQSLQLAAEGYLTNAGIRKDYSKELYKLAIKMLVLHWYDNREYEVIGKTVGKISYSLNYLIVQLKYSQGDVT